MLSYFLAVLAACAGRTGTVHLYDKASHAVSG